MVTLICVTNCICVTNFSRVQKCYSFLRGGDGVGLNMWQRSQTLWCSGCNVERKRFIFISWQALPAPQTICPLQENHCPHPEHKTYFWISEMYWNVLGENTFFKNHSPLGFFCRAQHPLCRPMLLFFLHHLHTYNSLIYAPLSDIVELN